MKTDKKIKDAMSKMSMNAISKIMSKYDLEIVTHNNLDINRCVIDDEGNKGKIVNIDDLHNVEIEYDNGSELRCFVEGCKEYIYENNYPIYYCDENKIDENGTTK